MSICRVREIIPVLLLFLVSGISFDSVAQDSPGENIDLWQLPDTDDFLDTMWLGGVFLRDTTKPLEVWLSSNHASCQGALHFMDPNGDTAVYLFENFDPSGTKVDLTGYNVAHFDTIFFMYEVNCFGDFLQLYTGPNRRDGDAAFLEYDRYSSNRLENTNIPGKSYPPLRRWSIAGWVIDQYTGARTDTVQFGFEDRTDYDFNDIIFRVRGVFLNKPDVVDSLDMTAMPASGRIPAGDSVVFTAHVLIDSAQTGNIKPDRDLSANITWQLIGDLTSQVGDTTNPGLKNGSGPDSTNTFYGVRASDDPYMIVASYFDDETQDTLRDTMQIYVDPGPAHTVIIEETNTPDRWTPNPEDTITITQTENSAETYAFLRDRFGNLISDNSGRAVDADWTARVDSVADVTGRSGDQWIGDISRNGSGNTQIIASYNSPVQPDSVVVKIVDYTYVKLRVVKRGTDSVITEININTDQQIDLEVQGLRSNAASETEPGAWEVVSAAWTFGDTLESDPGPPASDQRQSNWLFSPTKPGEGYITVERTDAGQATVPVIVTVAPPSKLTITLLEDSVVAGVPFLAVVTIENTDGLVPGIWCYDTDSSHGQVKYQDIMDKGTNKPDPTVDAGSGDTNVNTRPDTSSKTDQCFENGIDTVEFVLYNAPPTDNNHQLYVLLQGTVPLEAHTDRFRVYPGPVDSVVLEMPGDIIAPGDTVLTAPQDNLFLTAIGYDEFGNRIGAVPGRWESTESLHDINPGPTNNLFFSTLNVAKNEQGCVVVTSVDNINAQDSICITIISPAAIVMNSFTRDLDADGLLDQIDVYFDKSVNFPTDYDLNNVEIKYESGDVNASYKVTEIVRDTADSAIFYFKLEETEIFRPQTGWTPSLSIKNADEVNDSTYTVIDGAAPVIWKVVKEIVDIDDRTRDEVTIIFSEELARSLGTRSDDEPQLIFYVWESTDTDTFRTDTMIAGIDFFLTSKTSNQAKFRMVNGMDLTINHLMNIQVNDSRTEIIDDKNNLQNNENNRLVRVEITGVQLRVSAGPNPFPPTANDDYHQDKLVAEESREVAQRAYYFGGTAFTVDVPLPSNPANIDEMKITGSFKVYDIAGNLVYKRKTEEGDNLVLDSWKDDWSGDKKLGFFWSGLNDKKMKVAAGAYRAIVYLKIEYIDAYDQDKVEELVETESLGVRRGAAQSRLD